MDAANRKTLEETTRYDPGEVEARVFAEWVEGGYFHPAAEGTAAENFSVAIPPPNVTGALHMGHALNNTLQDVIIRWRRMQGFNALWLPGTDHAGIATQAVVERRLREEEGKTRHDLGRDELVRRIWQWKDQYEKRMNSPGSSFTGYLNVQKWPFKSSVYVSSSATEVWSWASQFTSRLPR